MANQPDQSQADLLQRIQDLEAQLAFQDNTIDALDAQVQTLNRLLERLELKCATLEQRMQELQTQTLDQPVTGHEVPPHY
ncbi:MAG: SlyX family protein [Pseudomonadota bacterium]